MTLYLQGVAVVGTPDTSDTLVGTLDRLLELLDLLAARVPQDLSLLQNFERLHVPDTNRSLAAVDEVAHEDGMLGWSWRHCELDLGMRSRELWENGFDKAATSC